MDCPIRRRTIVSAYQRIIRLSACLAFTSFIVINAASASGKSAEEGSGFQPGHTLIDGPGGDFISPFSGDVETVIDIGPTLQAGGGLELGLKLHHSSKIWVSTVYRDPNSALRRRGAFGVGWRMHLGRVYQSCDGDCSGIPRLVYESPDGAQHEISYGNDASAAQNGSLVYTGTADGTNIRVEAFDPNGQAYADADPNFGGGIVNIAGWRLYMGNGVVYTLARKLESSDANHDPNTDSTDDFRGWYTTKIERMKATTTGGETVLSPVGQITVTYDSGTLAHCMKSIEFRALPVDPNNPNLLTEQRRITFRNINKFDPPSHDGGVTEYVDFPALNGAVPNTASYHFVYAGPYKFDFIPPNDPNSIFDRTSGVTAREFVLTSIEYPPTIPGQAGYIATFDYDLPTTSPASPGTGEMVSRKLPTGAVIKYRFETYSYEAQPGPEPDPTAQIHLREVTRKTVYLGDPAVDSNYPLDPNYYIGNPSNLTKGGTWGYYRFRGGGSHPLWSKISDPFNNDTVYEFPTLYPGQAGTVTYFRGGGCPVFR
jgi:hypothetical protein